MSIVQNSLNVAHAYLDEHGQVIRTDIVNMAKDLDDAAPTVASDAPQVSRADVCPGRPARPARRLCGRRQGRGEGGRARGREDPLRRSARAPDPRGRGRAGAAADAEGHLPRGGADQASQLPGCLSLRRPRRRPGGGQAPAAHRGGRAHLRKPAPGQGRPQVRARHDVFHDLAHGAAGRDLGRDLVCRPLRRADPAADQRGPARDQGQPEGRAADPARRGRPAPPVDEFQHHDQGAGAPAHRPRHRQHPAHRTAPLHGGGALRRFGRRHRPRSPRPHHARQPLGGEAAGPRRRRAHRPPARRGGAGVRGHAERSRRAQGPAAAPGHPHHRRRGAQLLGARDARGAGRGGLRLGADLRRRHRAGLGAAHVGLGRRRPPHRPRDQEPL